MASCRVTQKITKFSKKTRQSVNKVTMGIFSEAEKSLAQSLLTLSTEEFNQDILIIRDGKKTVISEDLSYNYIYKRNSEGVKSYTEEIQRQTVQGSILYGAAEQDTWSDPHAKSQFRIKIPSNTVRIRSTKEVYDILKESKRIELEGKRYSFATDFKPHGLFTTAFYDCFLQVIDEED